MSKKLLFFALSLGAFCITAQPVIDSAGYFRAPAYVDSIIEVDLSSVTTAAVGVNQTWDYSNIVLNGTTFGNIYDAKDSVVGYPKVYQFYQSDLFSPLGNAIESYEFTSFNNTGYYASAYFTVGIVDSIYPLTNDKEDLIVIPQQRIDLDGDSKFLEFPATYQSQWNSKSSRKTQFQLTYTSQGLNQTPGYFDKIELFEREVEGYGTVILPDANGNPLPPLQALLIKSKTTLIDSIYLGGMPAPTSLVSAFGYTQGSTIITEQYFIYAVGIGYPVVVYGINAQGGLRYFDYRLYAAKQAASLNLNTMTLNNSSVYPNPISAGQSVFVEMEQVVQVNTVTIYDLSGKLLENMRINKNTNKLEVKMPASLQSGLYSMQLIGANGEALVSELIQVKP